MLLATFVATLSLGIEEGIGIGVVLSLVWVIYRSAYPHIAELANIPNTKYYRNIKRFPELHRENGVLIVRFDAQLFFANINFFRDKVNEMIQCREDKIELLILDFAAVNEIDSSALHMLHEFHRDMDERDIAVKITSLRGPVRDKFELSGIFECFGKDNFYLQISEAIYHFKNKERSIDTQYATQSGH